jgi:diguanylate cyclase (GGDEF)-like protein
MLDVDHFKSVNDRHGHAMGDRVLAAVAQTVQTALHGEGDAFRYGGEEIGVLLPAAEAGCLAGIGERLRAAVAALELDPGQGPALRITVSLGAAASAGGVDWRGIIERADAALYLAKREGRNRVVLAG